MQDLVLQRCKQARVVLSSFSASSTFIYTSSTAGALNLPNQKPEAMGMVICRSLASISLLSHVRNEIASPLALTKHGRSHGRAAGAATFLAFSYFCSCSSGYSSAHGCCGQHHYV